MPAVPFAGLFYGQRIEYMWEDDLGEMHTISQGEGGEQGDAMKSSLFSLGQHRALEEMARRLTPGEHLLAFMDDTFFVSPPHQEVSLWRNAGIRIHVGKTQLWNRAGKKHIVRDRSERAAQTVNPNARVWR